MPFSESFDSAIANPSPLLRKFRQLLEPAPPNRLEALAQRSKQLTEENFGKTMRLFAPLYMSNECVNNCQYCGFSRDNPILRVTLEIDQVVAEAEHLAAQGFRSILLVAGEHPKWVSNGYMEKCVEALRPIFSTIALEVGPMETKDYLGRNGQVSVTVFAFKAR
ncbi:MAG: radical SAM protein [Verrucomicrobiota bacterium]